MLGNQQLYSISHYTVNGVRVDPYDAPNDAIRVNAVAGGISLPNYDYVAQAQDATHDIWTFKTGGVGGTVVATVTITYTDATKVVISEVVRT